MSVASSMQSPKRLVRSGSSRPSVTFAEPLEAPPLRDVTVDIQSPLQVLADVTAAEREASQAGVRLPRCARLDWWRMVQDLWSGPETVVVHTVFAPRHMKELQLEDARIISEKRYTLGAGQIPLISLLPDYKWKTAAEQPIPAAFAIPNAFTVREEDPLAEYTALMGYDDTLRYQPVADRPTPTVVIAHA